MICVQGIKVSDQELEKMLTRMKAGSFTIPVLQKIARDSGMPNDDGQTIRLVESLMKREQAAGNIKCYGRVWEWVKKERDIQTPQQPVKAQGLADLLMARA